jgi:hypothetical protein
MRRIALAVALLLSACAKPPHIDSTLDIKRTAPDLIVLTLKTKNPENRASTPILIDVTVETRTGDAWSKPTPIIHPAAYVLNRHEEREIKAKLQSKATEIRGSLTIKEGETGSILKQEPFDKILP